LFIKETKIDFSCFARFFNAKRHKKFCGSELRTYLSDVGEVLQTGVGKRAVHVLPQAHLDEEEGLEDLDLAETLLL
jgi:hypothetical protein